MNALRRLLAPVAVSLLLLTTLCSGSLRADDIDIYRNPLLNSLQPPATIIALDLNLLGICDNVLAPPTSTLNPSLQSCTDARLTATLSTLLGTDPTTILKSLSPAALCGLATSIVPGLSVVLTLACSTVATLPLGTTVTTQLVSLVAGVLTPFLPTVIGMLPSTITNALNIALPGLAKIVAAPLALANLTNLLNGILNTLINSQVAIIVSHNNLGSANGTPVPYKLDSSVSYPNGNRYACDFNDTSTSSSLSTRTRDSTTGCSNGAYFLVGFTKLLDTGTVNSVVSLVTGQLSGLFDATTGLLTPAGLSATLQTTITGLLNGNTLALTPPYQGKEIYDEIFHLLSGDALYNSRLKTYDGLFSVLSPANNSSGGKYTAPSLTCRTINVLNIQATNSLYDSDSDVDIGVPTANYFSGVDLNPAGASTTPVTATGFGNLVAAAQNTGFPASAPSGSRFKINSYFVVRDNLSTAAALSTVGSNLLTYTGALGVFNLGQSIANLLKPILSVDATLSSAVTTDRIDITSRNLPSFLAEFLPITGQKPAWPGNLKRIDLKQTTDSSGNKTLSYVDKNQATAIDSTDGRIKSTALTFWTNASLLGTNISADGRTTTLGGAGQNIPGYALTGGGNPGRKNADAQRTLYYDAINSASKAPSLAALDADTSTTAAVTDLTVDTGATAETAANCLTDKTVAQVTQEILLYARGLDTGTSCKGSKGAGTTAAPVTGRSWLMGAVMHSRPVAINYGARSGYSVADPDVRVIFGSADGYLRMVNNGTAAAPSGKENWAFMPRATMANLKVLRDNQNSSQLPYGVDGAPSVLFVSGTDTAAKGTPGAVYAYFGLRRGGSNVYGLDLTNPDVPSLMWRIGTDGTYSSTATSPGLISGSAANFAELGMTFSTPAVGKVQLAGETTPRSVVVFGAGYNGGYDSSGARIGKDLNNSRNPTTTPTDNRVGTDDQPATGSGRGNALYMVDAKTGQLLWKSTYKDVNTVGYASVGGSAVFYHPLMVDSIPSEVTLVDTDGDGLSDRLYVGDTGGRVWRADFPGTDRSKWTVSLLASIGRHGAGVSTSFADDRRFFLAPDYVPTRDSSGAYDAVIIGSGDREDPFNAVTGNALYAFRDADTVSGKSLTDTTSVDGVISSESDKRLLTRLNVTDLTTVCANGTAGCAASSNLANGWQLAFSSGEKMASTPISANGAVLFDTFLPTTSVVCTPSEGSGRVYGVSLADSRGLYIQFVTADNKQSRYTTTLAPGLQGQVQALTPTAVGFNADSLNVTLPPTTRIYWRERRSDEEKLLPQ